MERYVVSRALVLPLTYIYTFRSHSSSFPGPASGPRTSTLKTQSWARKSGSGWKGPVRTSEDDIASLRWCVCLQSCSCESCKGVDLWRNGMWFLSSSLLGGPYDGERRVTTGRPTEHSGRYPFSRCDSDTNLPTSWSATSNMVDNKGNNLL